MTKSEYIDYEAKVHAFFEREGITNLTFAPDAEEFFSWKSCECCKSSLGGIRFEATGYNPSTGEIQKYEVCPDCIYYAAYGVLDDQTMLDMEE